MTRLALVLVAAMLAVGCRAKPTEADCRKAIANMQRLMGTDTFREDARIEGEVRRCKGGSKIKAVQCAIKAQTLADLEQCDFYKVPHNSPGLPGTQNAPGSAGSAAGSASDSATGAAAGSATGSATGAAAGSAGSANGSAAGSAVPAGSAAGSATGSATGSGSAK